MTSDFGQRVFPVIRQVLDLLSDIRSGRASLDPQLVATALRTLLAQFDVQGERRKEFLLARSALVYWIDEVLVNSEWEYAGYWSNHTLERSYFDSRERAFQFFQKAEVARSLDNLDALETFYLCACFGFKGVYRDDSPGSERESNTSNDDTWDPDQDESGEPAPAGATDEQQDEKPSGAGKLDWWDSDEAGGGGMATWGIGADELSESILGEATSDASVRAPLPSRTKGSQATTLQEWIDSVYRQLAPAVQPPYTPGNSPSELGNADPLTGRPALSTAATMLILGFGLFVVLLIFGLAQQA